MLTDNRAYAWLQCEPHVLTSCSCVRRFADRCARVLADVRLGRVTRAVESAMTAAARPLPARPDGLRPTDVHCTRDGSDAVNTAELAKLHGDEHVYNAQDTGVLVFLQNCIVPSQISLKVGYEPLHTHVANDADIGSDRCGCATHVVAMLCCLVVLRRAE